MIIEKYVISGGAGIHDGSSEANAYSFLEMLSGIASGQFNVLGQPTGHRYNIKKGIGFTGGWTISGSGSFYGPLILRGYNNTPGDGYLGRDSQWKLIETNMPFLDCKGQALGYSNPAAARTILESLSISGISSDFTLVNMTPGENVITRCVIKQGGGSNGSVGAFGGGGVASNSILYNNDIYHFGQGFGPDGENNAATVVLNGQAEKLIGNRIQSFGGYACILINTDSAFVANNLIIGNSGYAVKQNGNANGTILLNNTFVGHRHIFKGFGDIRRPITFINNIMADSSGFAFAFNGNLTAPQGEQTSGIMFIANNRFRNNPSGTADYYPDWYSGTNYDNISGNGNWQVDYVDAPNQDFRLISSSPAVSAGHPTAISMGVFQRNQSGQEISSISVG